MATLLVVDVPNLQGLSETAAAEILAGRDLAGQVTAAQSSAEPDLVIDQAPDPGWQFLLDRKISYVVSSGPHGEDFDEDIDVVALCEGAEPPTEHQYDGSTSENTDSGRAVAVLVVDYLTCGLIRPTTEDIGVRMGNRDGPTNMVERKRAIDSYSDEAEELGLGPIDYELTPFSGAALSRLWDLLESGTPATVAIEYGIVYDKARECYALDARSDVAHSVWARAGRTFEGEKQVLVYDSLADGRVTREGNEMPSGPMWWPWSTLKDAAAALPPGGHWLGGYATESRPYTGDVDATCE